MNHLTGSLWDQFSLFIFYLVFFFSQFRSVDVQSQFLIIVFISISVSIVFSCQLTEELQNVRESESRYKQQHIEAQKREKMLVRRLAAKEQELQEYVVGF